MIEAVLLYFIKIGIPAFFIGYAAKVKYQQKYVENIAIYIDQIKELDTECKSWENEYNKAMFKYDEALQENRKLRIQLELEG